ncbi:hypothetical protein CTAYLR_007460 [Chrysophaeum taylorii]|uniref:MORN repeat-containing protein 5 n=1 Tax=Chrysophaeum taylorii TaxID=2483200 RepID=A0AAD7XMT9_9STRA|nr:hypothetical protein CTAYLR_007460 [Chrysophaeum taylorii]
MAGALRENLHGKLLARMALQKEEIKEENLSIAELVRCEQARKRAEEVRRQKKLRQKQLRKDAEEASTVALAATKFLEKLAKQNQEEELKIRRYDEMLAEMERKTKRFFDVVVKGKVQTTGTVYFGDFVELGDDWLPHGYGEIRLSTGETVYEGDFSYGLRHGHGKVLFENGDEWMGTFYKDQARGLGTYKWCAPELGDGTAREPRRAIYHADARRAWLDELIPGKRLRVHRSPFGLDGTIVGIKDHTPVCTVYFDATGRREVVNLAHQSFELLHHQTLFHRVESTRFSELLRYEYERDDGTATSSYDENFFSPEPKQSAADDDAGAKQTESNRNGVLKKKSVLDDAMSDQRLRATEDALEESAIAETTQQQNLARKNTTRS